MLEIHQQKGEVIEHVYRSELIGEFEAVEQGCVVDWVVVMRRFDQAALFDKLAKTGRLNASLVTELADHIAALHRCRTARPDHGGAAARAVVAETNHCCLMASRLVLPLRISSRSGKDHWSSSRPLALCSTGGAAGKVRAMTATYYPMSAYSQVSLPFGPEANPHHSGRGSVLGPCDRGSAPCGDRA